MAPRCYGHGPWLDVLHACNAAEAQATLVCVEKREATDEIVEVLGASAEEAAAIRLDVSRRDAERIQLELVSGLGAGNGLLRGTAATPRPSRLRQKSRRRDDMPTFRPGSPTLF